MRQKRERLRPIYQSFDDILHIAAENSTTMPRLFELEINNQNLAGRALFSEIKNPNIVNLYIYKSRMNDITGIDTLGNQLLTLSVQRNDFSIEDLKKISNISKSNPYFRYTLFKNSTLESTINGLSANALSDETYNYLDSYFRRSGYIGYRNLQYLSQYSINQRKKTMLDDLSRWSLENVPYFIEDAKLMRDILPHTNNPFMVKDLATFENLGKIVTGQHTLQNLIHWNCVAYEYLKKDKTLIHNSN